LGSVDWLGLDQDKDQWTALLNVVMNLRVPYNLGKFLSGCTTSVVSSSAQLHKERERDDTMIV
jgi:hypothetical protein